MGVFASISKSVSLLFTPKLRSGAREVNATPLDGSEVGQVVDKMPEVVVEWRFNIRRDIIVTLML
jgi:hypothetical protein